MDENLRTQQLDRIKAGTNYSEMQIVYRGTNRKLPVYEIPLDVLVFNKYNGRIASRVKSFEKQNRELDPAKSEDRKIIEGFLRESHVSRNKQTIDDLRKNQQLRFGIVTRDGVIIDGNRRAMLLGKIAEEDKVTPGYFKAVILDDRVADNPREIMRLETTYQLGEDEKLGYNAIEKYLKVKDLLANDFKHEDIAEMMGGTTPGEIKEIEGIMKLMDRYLNLLSYDEIYTRLDGTEGIFVDLHQYLSSYRGKGAGKADWNFDQDADLADLEVIYFDMIRARHSTEGKDYRYIGKPSKEGSFFCKEQVWKEFKDFHFKHIGSIPEKSIDEIKRENPGKNLDELLKQRDLDWTDKATDKIKENIGLSMSRLADVNETNAPLKLLNRAYATLQAINTRAESFWRDDEVEKAVNDINTLTYEFKKAIKSHRKS